jgi:6-phosphogluconolactonase (cycloisomerase 2 family)
LALSGPLGCGGGSGTSQPPPPPASNPVPSIASVSPSSTTAGAQSQTLTIQGSNFLSSSTATYNGQAHTATFLSSTQLTISLSANDQATAGNYPVVVTNPPPGGGTSNAVNFTVNNPQPSVTSVTPSVLAAGSPDTAISVVGTNFVAQSTVNLNGAALPTTFVSSTQLSATVPASSLSSSGTDPITVSSPTPGGGMSAPLNLMVTKPRPAGVSGPAILSVPPAAALVGKAVQYQVLTSSDNPSSLVFSLSASPTGMTINATTGLLQWTPGSNQAGDQPVTIVAQDSVGQTTQSFTLSVFASRPVASATISAATGGMITVNDPSSTVNGLSISIPAGALASDTTITVSEFISPPTLGGTPRFFLKGFSVDPDGTQLAVPAQIRVPYSTTEFSRTQGIPLEDFLGVYSLQVAIGAMDVLTGFSVDKVSHVVAGAVPHFSVYFVSNITRLCPPPTSQSDCPDTPPAIWAPMPTVLVHGFQLSILTHKGGMGNESTWGKLRYLLQQNQIDAWRFDWDSNFTKFRISAANLDFALCYIELKGVTGQQCPTSPTNQPLVNLVAHSFGGILVRTYLEGLANSSDPSKVPNFPYRNDVNRVMTIGTPHSGISLVFQGNQSTFLTDLCFITTCVDAYAYGTFMKDFLNKTPLPALNPALSPQYDFIAGRARFQFSSEGFAFQVDDGLITTVGNQLCGTLPGGGPGFSDVCKDPSVTVTEDINPDTIHVPNDSGLCHTALLFNPPNPVGTCQARLNTAMAAVDSDIHPLWDKICTFLGGCAPPPPPPTITSVSVSCNPAQIQVNGTSRCAANVTGTGNFDPSVTWSADVGTIDQSGNYIAPGSPGTATITATSNQDATKNGTFTISITSGPPQPTAILTVTSTPSSGVTITVSPADNNGQGNGTTLFTRTYNAGTMVSLTAQATAGGNSFSSWTGCDSSSGINCTVTVNSNRTVTANYGIGTSQLQCAYVANQLSNNVSAYTVDPATGKLGAVAGSPFAVVALPKSVAADPAGRFLYVANSGAGNSLWISAFAINASTCALTEVPGSPFPPIPLSFTFLAPTAVAVHPSGNFLYMTSLTGEVACFVIDHTSGALSQCTGSFAPAGTLTNSIALHPTGNFAYVTNQGGNVSGYTIDSTTGNLTPLPNSPFPVTCNLPGSCIPVSVALDPLGNFAYVANSDFTISGFSINSSLGTLSLTPKSPFTESNQNVTSFTSLIVHRSGDFVLAAATGVFGGTPPGFAAVLKIDRSSGDLTEVSQSPFPAGTDPSSIAADGNGHFIYVVNQTSSSISCYALDANTGVLTQLECGVSQTGAQPSSIVVTAVGSTP